MGIRFERDSKKATNGPLIFFSILHDETFEEEIRSAFINGLSFYAYRFPNDNMFSYGSSEGFIEGIGEPGFVIGFFDSEKPFLTIPYKGHIKDSSSSSLFQFPDKSTSFESYSHEVDSLIEELKKRKSSKVVAARVVVKAEESFDIAEKFYELNERFPNSFIFCFSTPATGCWLGASPELLLSGSSDQLQTMALAGTRTAHTKEPWNEKNIEEQKIVTDYITTIFFEKGFQPTIGQTYSHVTGNIEHICTPISANIYNKGIGDLEGLLKDLSPTPALCGYPKDFAFKEIRHYENFDRGCYGGFCGPFHSIFDFNFNVVVRCVAVNEKKQVYYTGGGITSLSKVKEEWDETALKLFNTFRI